MMQRHVAFLGIAIVLLWTIGSSFAAEVGDDHTKKELEKLQGAWIMSSGESDGKPFSDEHVSKSKIVYEGATVQLVTPHRHGDTFIGEIVKIDPTKNPKEFHFVNKTGPHAGKTVIAIYEFVGDDQYRIAFDPTGAMVVKEFSTKPGSGHFHHVWKRAK